MNKPTALVYGGAAFLILVFGVKTLSRTVDSLGFLESILNPLTGIALLAEFSLLIYYAKSIYNQPDSSYNAKSNNSNNNITDFVPVTEKLDQINSTMNDFTDQMAEIKDHLSKYNNQIISLNDKLEDIVDDKLDERVKSVLSDMFRNRNS
jgi:peptidoglycan hydrolase CwlO-like protein